MVHTGLEEVLALQVSFAPIYVWKLGHCIAEELAQEPEEEQKI